MYTLFIILIAEPQFPVGCRHELRPGGNRIPDFVFCLDEPAGNHIRVDFAVEEVDDFGNNTGQDLNEIRLRLSDELDALFDRGGIDDEYAEDRPESEGVGFPDQPAARRDDACRSETLVYELKGGDVRGQSPDQIKVQIDFKSMLFHEGYVALQMSDMDVQDDTLRVSAPYEFLEILHRPDSRQYFNHNIAPFVIDCSNST